VILADYGLRLAAMFIRRGFRRVGTAALGEWVTRLLTALGPSYIKVGQLISTRRDLLPGAVCAALGRLTDATPPPRRRQLERVVRRAYRDREWPFADFGWTPIACGSIATVHRAVLADGRHVAVKVRRPGIARIMYQDFGLIQLAAGPASMLPALRGVPVRTMIDQVGSAMLRQLDFVTERESLMALHGNFRAFEGVRIPEPVLEFCTEEIIVMEFVSNLVRFTPGDLAADVRRDVVRRALATVYEMLFVDGLVHCDLHPGNLYFDRDAQLVILDAGFVVRLPDVVRNLFSGFFVNMALGRGRRCADIIIESAAELPRSRDLDGFRTDLTTLVASVTGARAKDFQLGAFAARLFDLQRRHGLHAAPEFAFPLLSLLVLEGMINGFDADVDFQAEAIPVLLRRNARRTRAPLILSCPII
jgi:ubiquinone biosynthesis protein